MSGGGEGASATVWTVVIGKSVYLCTLVLCGVYMIVSAS